MLTKYRISSWFSYHSINKSSLGNTYVNEINGYGGMLGKWKMGKAWNRSWLNTVFSFIHPWSTFATNQCNSTSLACKEDIEPITCK